MKIGRLEFGIAKGNPFWGWNVKGFCGCRFFDIGKFYVTWIHKDCM